MIDCKECDKAMSELALTCPNCGAPNFELRDDRGWGYEYKSKASLLGLPLLHVSFKYKLNGVPIPAKGIVAIGQFGIGVINISQFGIGLFSLSQFTIAGFAITQIGLAYSLIAQIGLYFDTGYGQSVWNILDLIKIF